MKVFRWIMFGLGMLLWIPSFYMVVRGFGGFVDFTTTEDLFWSGMFVLSLIIIYVFKPSWMSDT